MQWKFIYSLYNKTKRKDHFKYSFKEQINNLCHVCGILYWLIFLTSICKTGSQSGSILIDFCLNGSPATPWIEKFNTVVHINTMKTTFYFNFKTRFQTTNDTHKKGNHEEVSIISFLVFTCKLVIWTNLVRNQNFDRNLVFIYINADHYNTMWR